MESDVAIKCADTLRKMGWSVSFEEWIGETKFRADLVLRYNDKNYGFVEVVDSNNIIEKSKSICLIIDNVVKNLKPPIFILTNGAFYDIYHYGELYATLDNPPSPKTVDLILEGVNKE